MLIIVPETKRLINLSAHGIDLNDFEAGFSWDRYIVLPAHPSRTGRERQMFIGSLGERIVAAVVSPLGTEALAVISIRAADRKERDVYEAALS